MSDKLPLNISADFNLQDIIAIKISDIEVAIFNKEAQLIAEKASITKDIERINKKITEEIEKAFANKVSKIQQAIALIAGVVTTDVKMVALSYSYDLHRKELSCGTSIWVDTSSYTPASLKLHLNSEEMTATISDLVDELEKKKERYNDKSAELVDVRSHLSKMGMYERQIRGRLAREAISNKEGGKEFLENIDSLEMIGMPKALLD